MTVEPSDAIPDNHFVIDLLRSANSMLAGLPKVCEFLDQIDRHGNSPALGDAPVTVFNWMEPSASKLIGVDGALQERM